MKRKIALAIGAVLLIAAVSAFVYVNNERNPMDVIFNANVDALADDESLHPDGYVNCFFSVYDDGSPGYYLRVRRCFDCREVDATQVSDVDKCMP